MSSILISANRYRQYLFPPSMQDWLPEDHLALFVVDIVSQLDLRSISANTHPDDNTIATFRKRFLNRLQPLFVQILLLAREMGLLKVGKVSLDGTKAKVNVSKHHVMSWDHACKIEQPLQVEVQELLRFAEKVDIEATPDGMIMPEEIGEIDTILADAGYFSYDKWKKFQLPCAENTRRFLGKFCILTLTRLCWLPAGQSRDQEVELLWSLCV